MVKDCAVSEVTHVASVSLIFIAFPALWKTAFDIRSKPAKEVLRQMQSERFSSANPKMKVTPFVVGTPHSPVIDFSFIDGSQMNFVIDNPEQHCKEMLDQVWQHTIDMDFQFEIDGKEIESF